MIRDIDIKYLEEKQFISENIENYIYGFKRVNIFIGENNSGKSRFMRSLLLSLAEITKLNNNVVKGLQQNGKELIILLNKINKRAKSPILDYSGTNLENVILGGDKIAPIYFLNKLKIDNPYIKTIKEYYGGDQFLLTTFSQITQLVTTIFNSNHASTNLKETQNYYYIPILRGLKPLQTYENKFVYDTIYSNRIIKDYEGIKKVFTGLEIFEGVKQKLLGDERDRSIIKEFEDFISENLFGEHVILIPKYGDDILNIKIGTEPQRSIVDLGDGLQALICILFPIFMEKDKEYFFFIEEPELNLHPLLQKKLVNLLSDDLFSKHQFFITTHSAHFINQKNSSVFNFYREGDKTLVGYLDNNQKIISALNNLGYKPSDLLQTNFIIWVEGPSDKIYITYLINKVAPELIENQHYTIMFYGGSSGKYLFEDDKSGDMILSLNRNCAFICDSDRDSKICTTQKHLNTTKLVTQLSKAGVYAWMTPYREFENHIDSDLFLEAVKNILNEPTAVLVENTEYSDKFVIKTNEKTNKSPKQNIRLTNKLYELIKKRDNKNKVHKIDLLILQEELQISIDQTINFTEQKVDKKVPIADYIVKKGFEPDKHLMKMVSELIVKIKAVNKI